MNKFRLVLFLQLLFEQLIYHECLRVGRVKYPKTHYFTTISAISSNNPLKTTNPISGDYSHSYWSKAFRSQTEEFDYTVSDIEGNLPSSFHGTLFRNMPALFERGDTTYGHYLGEKRTLSCASYLVNGHVHAN